MKGLAPVCLSLSIEICCFLFQCIVFQNGKNDKIGTLLSLFLNPCRKFMLRNLLVKMNDLIKSIICHLNFFENVTLKAFLRYTTYFEVIRQQSTTAADMQVKRSRLKIPTRLKIYLHICILYEVCGTLCIAGEFKFTVTFYCAKKLYE